jgi:hypothetical protein
MSTEVIRPVWANRFRDKVAKRFFSKVEFTMDCWIWRGAKSQGYGSFNLKRYKTIAAYRYSYDFFMGKNRAGLQLDHICRNRLCVNPAHLEPVTQKVNIMRGIGFAAINARKTHCKNGHEFTLENIYLRKDGGRKCRKCIKIYNKRRRDKYGSSIKNK